MNKSMTQFELLNNLVNNLHKFKITPTSKLVLLYLAKCWNPKKGYMYPKASTISKQIGISESSVGRAVKELCMQGIILYEAQSRQKFMFTTKLMNLLHIEIISPQIEQKQVVNLKASCHEQRKLEQKKHTKTPDDEINNYPLNEYRQIINKLNTWNVIGAKKIIGQYGIQKVNNLIKIVEKRKPDNAGAYFRSLLNLPDDRLPIRNNNSNIRTKPEIIEYMIKSKYWQHIPTGKRVQVKPDIGEHLLIKYHQYENMVTFYETGLTDKLENFEIAS